MRRRTDGRTDGRTDRPYEQEAEPPTVSLSSRFPLLTVPFLFFFLSHTLASVDERAVCYNGQVMLSHLGRVRLIYLE